MKYHKLIRDRIPEIIERSGGSCITREMDEAEYIAMLEEKLSEELAEYMESKSMEELADLMEVIRAVAAARGSSIAEVEAIRARKAQERGGFDRRLLLLQTQKPDE